MMSLDTKGIMVWTWLEDHGSVEAALLALAPGLVYFLLIP